MKSSDDGSHHTAHTKDLNVSSATFVAPDLTTFAGLDELGLVVTGQRVEPERAILECRLVKPDDRCGGRGCQGLSRNTVKRLLTHEPFGWRPTTLEVRLRRYRCQECAHVSRQNMDLAAEPMARLSRRAVRWALEALVCHHLSVSRIAQGLSVAPPPPTMLCWPKDSAS